MPSSYVGIATALKKGNSEFRGPRSAVRGAPSVLSGRKAGHGHGHGHGHAWKSERSRRPAHPRKGVSEPLVSSPSRLVSSRLVSSRLVSSRLVSSRLVSSRLVSSRTCPCPCPCPCPDPLSKPPRTKDGPTVSTPRDAATIAKNTAARGAGRAPLRRGRASAASARAATASGVAMTPRTFLVGRRSQGPTPDGTRSDLRWCRRPRNSIDGKLARYFSFFSSAQAIGSPAFTWHDQLRYNFARFLSVFL